MAMRRRKKPEQWSGPLPWQIEVLLVVPGIGGALFAIWNVYNVVQNRTAIVTDFFGVSFDIAGLLWQLRIPLAFMAFFAALRWHFTARKWVCRRLAL